MADTVNKADNHLLWHPPDSDTPGPAGADGEHIRNLDGGKLCPYVVAVPCRQPNIVSDW